MKKIICIILLLFLTTVYVEAKKEELSLIGKVIVIDPGHGGLDKGTSFNDISEKDINLSLSLILRDELKRRGASVILTRDGDYDLSFPNTSRRKKSDFDNRINLINSSNANMYLSIHVNYLNNSKYYGPQVFYNDSNRDLALSIQKELNKGLNTSREAKIMDKNYYMYKRLNIPGVLIECGFISNETERNKLVDKEYQKKISNYIINGIVRD